METCLRVTDVRRGMEKVWIEAGPPDMTGWCCRCVGCWELCWVFTLLYEYRLSLMSVAFRGNAEYMLFLSATDGKSVSRAGV